MLPKGDDRRYVVVDAQEWHLIAEGRGAPDHAVTLALAPGDYQVKRVLPDQIEVAALSLPPARLAAAEGLSYVPRAVGGRGEGEAERGRPRRAAGVPARRGAQAALGG